ncbi:MAG: YdeI/OmpD-associated family protein [Nanoarchaeota archaeon]
MKKTSKIPHKIPPDLQTVLTSFPKAMKTWEEITPLARNEFICWIEDAKKDETRHSRIGRTITDLMEGKRRPCCWAGCVH